MLQHRDSWAPLEERGRAESGMAARVHSPGHTGSERGGKKTHSSPYLLLAQQHGDMEWKWGLQRHVKSSSL